MKLSGNYLIDAQGFVVLEDGTKVPLEAFKNLMSNLELQVDYQVSDGFIYLTLQVEFDTDYRDRWVAF